MPNYVLKCSDCGKVEEKICMVKDRNSFNCKCGGKMEVQITTMNFIMYRQNPRLRAKMKKIGA